MAAALEQATRGLEAGELPIGAVVALDGEILARAFWRLGDGLLAHPELLVLLDADRSSYAAGRRNDLSLSARPGIRAAMPRHTAFPR